MASATPTVPIPEDDLAALKGIAELDEKQFSSLISALGEAAPSLSRDKFSDLISRKVKSIHSDEIESILRIVFILYMMKLGVETTADMVAETIGESAVESATEEIQFSGEEKTILKNRLKLLLGFDKSLAVTAKALDLMTEQEHVFCTARILSDIRPVFTESTASASAAVIIHHLQIRFHDSRLRENNEIFVALDTDNLEELKELIKRAEKKTEGLQSILDKAGITYLKP